MEFNYVKVLLNNKPFAILKLRKNSLEEMEVIDKLLDNKFKLKKCTEEDYEAVMGTGRDIELFEIEGFDDGE